MIGQTISHYKITEKLGEGGMGVVYKAQDTKLSRSVALKFLRSEATENADAKARFLREAQAAAALDHENVCTVYEIDEADGQTFLSMAYLEGETVREKTKTRPLKIEEALDIAIQTALGLQAAHEKEIVHRDIKSANLIVTPRGQVKITDFGLAQLAEQSRLTKTAMILGTPAYMSPEQARREPTDRRTDIWSLGVVIYEMLTGKLPFEGEREDAVAYAVVHQEPEPITALRVGVPVDLDRVIAKAMAKDPNERYQHIDEILVDLRGLRKEVQTETASVTRPAPARTPQSQHTPWLFASAAVLVALAVTAGAFLGLFESERPVTQEPLQAVPFTAYPGEEIDPDFSPDGEQVAFSWNGEKQDNPDIYVKRLRSDPPVRLTSHPAPDYSPAWSPDGRWIAFQRWDDVQGSVLLIPSIGGPERKMADLEGERGSVSDRMAWLPDSAGLIVAHGHPGSIFLVSIETGERRELIAGRDFGGAGSNLVLSPAGQTLVFTDSRRLHLLDLGADFEPIAPPRPVGDTGLRLAFPVAWSPDGSDLIVESHPSFKRELVRLPLAEPNRVRSLTFAGPGSNGGSVSARTNRLVFSKRHYDWNLAVLRRSGVEPGVWQFGSFPSTTRLEGGPRFSPDGKQLVFESDRSGTFGIWISGADGSDARELWVVDGVQSGMPHWSPDGRRVVFDSLAESEGSDFGIEVIHSSGGSPLPVTDDPAYEQMPSWSADGNRIYFISNRTGRFEVYWIPATGGEAEQITEGGGGVPFESPDGKFVYFLEGGLTFTGSSPLWRIPTAGGEKSLVLEKVWARNYALSRSGIYFIEPPRKTGGSFSFKFLDSASGDLRTLAKLRAGEAPGFGLTVSPDEQTIIYTEISAYGSDLMLVEGFE